MKKQVMTVKYKIEFFSQWHCGSGTSAGADVDELVVKDFNGMPFLPGKTVKGLVREAVENYVQFLPLAQKSTDGDAEAGATQSHGIIETCFGTEGKTAGCCHFTDAVLSEVEYESIIKGKLQKYLYRKLTTTAIGDDGTAREHSLRSMEVVVPCTLHGEITDVPEGKGEVMNMGEVMAKSLGLIKRLGQKRNRGLGRCDFKIEEEGGK